MDAESTSDAAAAATTAGADASVGSSAAPHSSDGAAGSSEDPSGAAASVKQEPREPPDLHKNPILQQWEWNSDGSLAGRVYGKKGYKEGEAMNTSVVPEDTRYSSYVVTGSGSIYRLGEPLVKQPKDAKARRAAAEAEAEGAARGSQRGAAALARVKMSASAVGTADKEADKGKDDGGSSGAKADPPAPPTPSDDGRSPMRERKRPTFPGSEMGPPAADEPPKKPKHANQYTKAAEKAAAAKAAAAVGSGGGSGSGTPGSASKQPSPRPSGELKDPNRPKHANQYTKLHQQHLEQQQQQQQQQEAGRPKQPNQYTYKPGAPNPPGSAGGAAPGSAGKPKQPNQYTKAAERERMAAAAAAAAKPSGPPSRTQPLPDGTPRPKQPNQYTKARDAERAAAAAADGDAPSSPAPSNPNAFFIGVSRLGAEWAARLVRSNAEDLLGTYSNAKDAAEAAAEMHAVLVRNGGKLPTTGPLSIDASPTPSSRMAGASALAASSTSGVPLPLPPSAGLDGLSAARDGMGAALPQGSPRSAGRPSSMTSGSSMTKIRVALVDTAEHTWIASPREPGGYMCVRACDQRPNGCDDASAPSARAEGAGAGADVGACGAGGGAGSSSGGGVAEGDDGQLHSPTRSSSRSAAHAATALLAGIYNSSSSSSTSVSKASAEACAAAERNGGLWMRCEACLKWRRLPSGQHLISHCGQTDRWTCAFADDAALRAAGGHGGASGGCDAPQERSQCPRIDERLSLYEVDETEVEAHGPRESRAGRELRPPRTSRSLEDMSREVLRARMPGQGAKRNRGDGKDGEPPSSSERPSAGRPPAASGSKPARGQGRAGGQQYLSGFSARTSTRIAVHEDGVWRFQPAVGEQYQIEVDEAQYPGTVTLAMVRQGPCFVDGSSRNTSDANRKRADVCVWSPERAEAEGINVPSYLLSCAKLFAVGRQAKSFSSELALQLLYSHAFDVLAATHSMATSIGVDKLLTPEAPVVATTTLVRGKSGLRVSLNLGMRFLAGSMARQQPESSSGYVRSTRSKTTTLDVSGQAEPWTADEEELLLEGMRKDGKDLATIRRNMLVHRPIAQVVDFFYSARGQKLKFIAMKDRELAERRAQQLAAGKDKLDKLAKKQEAEAAAIDDMSPKKKARKFGDRGDADADADKSGRLVPARSRPRGPDGAGRPGKRFGPRVFANVSVRGAHAEVRLRLRVKRVDLRRWGEADTDADSTALVADGGSAGGSRPVKHVAARCRVLGSGKVKLALQLKTGASAGRPPRNPRPKRPKEPIANDDDDEEDEGGNEVICTWLQCDRCSKWRIVPDNTDQGDNVWYCEMNPDHRHNRCEVPQQPDDAVVDFTGLLGAGAMASRPVAGAASARPTGPDGQVVPRGRGRPPGSGVANGKRKANMLAAAAAAAAAAAGGDAAAGGIEGGAGAGLPAPSTGAMAMAPARKRAAAGGAPRVKPKGHPELKRTHPPASAFAATVAAHAAHTAKLAADPTSFVPQAVAPLFACVVMPPGSMPPGSIPQGIPPGSIPQGIPPAAMHAASAAHMASTLGLQFAPSTASSLAPHGTVAISGPMLVSAAPPGGIRPLAPKRARDELAELPGSVLVSVPAPRIAPGAVAPHHLMPAALLAAHHPPQPQPAIAAAAPQRALTAPMTASLVPPSLVTSAAGPGSIVGTSVIAPQMVSHLHPSTIPAALQQPPSSFVIPPQQPFLHAQPPRPPSQESLAGASREGTPPLPIAAAASLAPPPMSTGMAMPPVMRAPGALLPPPLAAAAHSIQMVIPPPPALVTQAPAVIAPFIYAAPPPTMPPPTMPPPVVATAPVATLADATLAPSGMPPQTDEPGGAEAMDVDPPSLEATEPPLG